MFVVITDRTGTLQVVGRVLDRVSCVSVKVTSLLTYVRSGSRPVTCDYRSCVGVRDSNESKMEIDAAHEPYFEVPK